MTAAVLSPSSALALARLALDDPRWTRYVGSHPHAGAFHAPAWGRAIAECYGYDAFALAAIDAAGEIRAGLPVAAVRGLWGGTKWVAFPFTDRCGPLVGTTTSAVFVALLACERRARGLRAIEVRDVVATGPDAHAVAAGWWHELSLAPGAAALHVGMSRTHRQSVRRAREAGVGIERPGAREGIERFWALHVATRRRLGVPVQPRRFFRLLADRVLEPGGGFVLVATHGGRDVAAGVFLTRGRTVCFKFSASDAGAWDVRPNHLLAWTAIEWGAANGFRTFDWGRTDADDEGLRRYKVQFGSVELPLTYTRIAPTAGAVRSAPPAFLATMIRRSPLAVCRFVGEVFYRFAS